MTSEQLRRQFDDGFAAKKRIQADIHRAAAEERERKEKERKVYAPEPVPSDADWNAAVVKYQQLHPTDMDFVKARIKVARSDDCRDYGQFFFDLQNLLVPEIENQHDISGYDS
jgi:hypothetical protein